MYTKPEALAIVKDLVSRFEEQLPSYKKAEYNETSKLLQLHQQKATTKLESQLMQLQGKIEYCESRVDELVYGLYGVTEEERRVVEG
jgi:hypothetical protein